MKFLWMTLLWLLILTNGYSQCPSSKFGLLFNFSSSENLSDYEDTLHSLSQKGLGFVYLDENWRHLQNMKDSGLYNNFLSEVKEYKTIYGFDSIVLIISNPAAKSNLMPPVFCGNPWTDSNTTQAMFEFYIDLLDSLQTSIDYLIWGSNVDIYFKPRQEQADSFFEFTKRMADYIHSTYSNLNFSVGFSYNAYKFHNPKIDFCSSFSDFRAASFDFANADYWGANNILDSVIQRSHFLNSLNGLPFIIYQAEYPSSNYINSSLIHQSEFVEGLLRVHDFSNIEAVLFRYFTELDSIKVETALNTNLDWSSSARQYFSSLGFFDSLGMQKPASQKLNYWLDSLCIHSYIPDFNNSSFTITPNPANDFILFEVPSDHSDYWVLSSLGETILKLEKMETSQCKIDISSWASGVYYIIRKNNEGVQSVKFIKY